MAKPTPPLAAESICQTAHGEALATARWSDWQAAATPGGLRWEGPAGEQMVWTACDGLPATALVSIASHEERVILATRGAGIWALSPATGALERLGGALAGRLSWPTAIAVSAGALWVGTVQDGLWRIDLETSGIPSQPIRRFRTRRVSGLAHGPDGALYVARDLGGLWRVGPGQRERRVLQGSVQGLEVREGALWVDLGGVECPWDGKACAQRRPQLPAAAASASGLPSAHVSALAVAPAASAEQTSGGVLWAGTFDAGLVWWDGTDWIPLKEPGAPRLINQIGTCPAGLKMGPSSLPEPALCAATAVGFYVRTRSGWYRIGEDAGLPSNHVNGFALGQDGPPALWIGTSRGLARWDGHGIRVEMRKDGLPYDIVHGVAAGAERVYAATAYGLGARPALGSGWVTWRYGQAPRGIAGDWANAVLAQSDGSALVGTYDAGLDVLVGDAIEHVSELGRLWVNPNGLMRVEHSNATAVATLGDGLVLLHDDGSWLRWTTPSLPSNDVTAAVEWQGELWIATRSGLARWPLAAAARPTPTEVGRWTGLRLPTSTAVDSANGSW